MSSGVAGRSRHYPPRLFIENENGRLYGLVHPFSVTMISFLDRVRMSTSVMTNLWPAVIWLPTYFSATSGLT